MSILLFLLRIFLSFCYSLLSCIVYFPAYSFWEFMVINLPFPLNIIFILVSGFAFETLSWLFLFLSSNALVSRGTTGKSWVTGTHNTQSCLPILTTVQVEVSPLNSQYMVACMYIVLFSVTFFCATVFQYLKMISKFIRSIVSTNWVMVWWIMMYAFIFFWG